MRLSAVAPVLGALVFAIELGSTSCGGAVSPVDDGGLLDVGPPDQASEAGFDANDAGSPDAGPDRPCDPGKPFGNVTALTALNSPFDENGLSLVDGERLVFIGSQGPDGGASRILTAQRALLTDPFSPPKPVVALDGPGSNYAPALSADGKRIAWVRTGLGQLDYGDLWIADRDPISGVISNQAPIAELNTSTWETTPWLNQDGSELWFSRYANAPHQLVHAVRNGSMFTVTPLPGALNDGTFNTSPVVSADGLTLLWSSSRSLPGHVGAMDIVVATRASTSDAFSNVRTLEGVNDLREDYPLWISPDGCRLYLSSLRNTTLSTANFFIATRPK